MFGDDKPLPLTNQEIAELLRFRADSDEQGCPIQTFSQSTGISDDMLRYRLQKLNAKPIGRIGNANLYRLADLRAVCQQIRPWKKDYAIPAIR